MIIHIVGNRPQFIKLAPLYHELERQGYEQSIIHSGQHYDENMSEIFFEELNIPQPYINLMAGGGTHAEVIAKAMLGLEKELMEKKPKAVILYGDTNTTLAGAMVASKLCIPIAHVEAGTRTHHRDNPEECNRVVTDHLSEILFCPDQISMENLEREGLSDRSYLTGDIMYDTYLQISEKNLVKPSEDMILMTWHRQENTASKKRMESILNLIERLEANVICPLHPRTHKYLAEYGLLERAQQLPNLKMIDPVGYVEMVALMQQAKLILTDSGGVSKESSFAGAKCLFMVDLDVWEDLEHIGWLKKVNPENEASVQEAIQFAKAAKHVEIKDRPLFYGDGHAAKKMVDELKRKELI